MSRSRFIITIVGISAGGIVGSALLANPIPFFLALLIMGSLLLGRWHEQKEARQSTQPKTQKVAVAKKRAPKKGARPGSSPPVAGEAARRLRFLAAHYEHGNSPHFFQMSPVGVARTTSAQRIVGPGQIAFDQEGLTTVFRNQKSPTAKPRTVAKPWRDVMGYTNDGRFRIMFQDLTEIELLPLSPADRTFLSGVWEIMFELTRPPNWDNGPRHSVTVTSLLRQTANYLNAHSNHVSAQGDVSWQGLDLDARLLTTPPERLPSPPVPGDVFDGVVVKKHLGQGGFGAVFVVEAAESPGGAMALKVMKAPNGVEAWSQEFLSHAKAFIDESVLSSRFFDVPYIASSKDSGMEPWPWILYPLLEGIPVSRIRGLAVLAEEDWWNLAHDLTSALYFIHREGLVHRDIHFDNVMLQDDRAVVLDFGISHVAGHSQLKNIARAWPYASPESLRAEEPEDMSYPTDVFSAGLVLYEAILGVPAWPRGDNPAQRLDALTTMSPDFSGLPHHIRAVIEPMLALDPTVRPTAHDLLVLIAPQVDMEKKTRELEEEGKSLEEAQRTESALIQGEPYPAPDEITGPLVSWDQVTETLDWIIRDVRPRFFTVDIRTSRTPKEIYLQAITDGRGWTAEAMSDRFAPSDYGKRQRANFLALDWAAPTESSPNYQCHTDEHSPQLLSQAFLDALEIGYGVSLAEVKKVRFSIQGSDMYERWR